MSRRILLAMLVLAGVTAVAALRPPPSAAAATPCWRKVVDDWFDGKIDRLYAPSCYRDALRHLPADARNYTSATGDIQRAMLAAIAAERKPRRAARRATTTTAGSRQLQSVKPTPSTAPARSAAAKDAAPIPERVDRPLFDRLAAIGAGSGSGSLPLPIVVLAILGGLLLAAAGGSRAAQHLRRR